MRRFFILILFLLNLSGSISYATQRDEVTLENTSTKTNEFDWMPIINAIIQIESKGQTNAVSKDGKCVGVLQIQKVVVDDCNEYLKYYLNQSDKKFTYDDRYDKEKSIEMFLLIQKRYNKNNDIEKGIRIWNGGCRYSVEKTQIYYDKVMKCYNNQRAS